MSLVDNSNQNLSGGPDVIVTQQGSTNAAQAQQTSVRPISDETTQVVGGGIAGGVLDVETRTITRTTNLAGDTLEGEIRTVTRLSTQTGSVDSGSASAAIEAISTPTISSSDVVIPTSNGTASITQQVNSTAPVGSSSALSASNSSSASLSLVVNQPGAVATSPPDNANVDQITTFTQPSTGSPSIRRMMEMETSLLTMSTATNNRAAASTSSPSPESIFVPGHRLFPLGITVIALDGLFVLITITIILLKLCGWNKKRRLRLSIGSFMDVDPHTHYGSRGNIMYEPKFETITTNNTLDREENHHIASTNPFEPSSPEQSSARMVEAGFVGVGVYKPKPVEYTDYSRSTFGARPGQPGRQDDRGQLYYPYPGQQPGPLGSTERAPINPFDDSQPPRKMSTLDMPTDVDMGSPVPSFNTGRMAYTYPNPSAYTTNPDPASSAPSIRAPVGVGRSLTGSAVSSFRSEDQIIFGSNPTQKGGGYLPTQRQHRNSGSSFGSMGNDSMYSSSSGETDRIVWAKNGRPAYTAQVVSPTAGAGTLGKGAVWGSDRP